MRPKRTSKILSLSGKRGHQRSSKKCFSCPFSTATFVKGMNKGMILTMPFMNYVVNHRDVDCYPLRTYHIYCICLPHERAVCSLGISIITSLKVLCFKQTQNMWSSSTHCFAFDEMGFRISQNQTTMWSSSTHCFAFDEMGLSILLAFPSGVPS